MPTDNRNTLLLEIGTEELPPKSLNRLRQSLEASCTEGFAQAELQYEAITSFATPRRLAILVDGLSDTQPEQKIERRGPATKAAFDDDGNPTKALSGFMRSCGIDDPSQLESLSTDKGEWLVYRSEKPGAPLGELLPGIVDDALGKLPVDRRMRWGKSRSEFVRPVHWVVALYGSDVLPVEVLGIGAGRVSKGHRFMSEGEFEIPSANDYVEACLANHVMVNFDDRQAEIDRQIRALADSLGATFDEDSALLEEVTSLVEWPVALAGNFDERFLEVPPEVLVSAMKEHQRYFPLKDPGTGNLRASFITVANIESTDSQVVIAGNERVIRPRLSDARFFFEQDTKTPLDSKLDRLRQVVFQTELGSYHDKAERLSELAGTIANLLGADADLARRAGLLAKADLVTDMVGEFPDLQGLMGAYYAKNDGEPNEVVEGIEQHYRPSYSGGPLPVSTVACSVAIADKLDTLVGLFGINQPPTGSRDPFALRRQSLGVIRICIENELDLDINECLKSAVATYGASGQGFETSALTAYIIERLSNYYSDRQVGGDVVEAATAVLPTAGHLNLLALDRIINAINEFRSSEVAEQIVAANKRVANLLKKVDESALPAFDETLATDEAEKALHAAVASLDLSGDARQKLSQLATLQAPVDQFFEEVLVMADDAKLRDNRLGLLLSLRQLFLEVADFSLLQ